MNSAFWQKMLRMSRVSGLAKCELIAATVLCGALVAGAAPPYGQQPPQQGTNPRGGPGMQQQPTAPLPQVPPVDTTPLTEANTAVTKSKADLKKAQGVLFGASKRFEKTIDAKPDVQAATQELTSAQSGLQSATTLVMSSLKNDASYKDAQAKAATAKAAVEAMRGNPEAMPDQRYAAAKTSLAANDAVSKIETAALAAEPKVAAARAKVAASSDAVHKLRAQYETEMHEDPAYVAASKDVAEKQAKADAADKQLADARKTVADRQAAHQAAVVARNKAEADNAARSGSYGAPAGYQPPPAPGR